MDASDCCLDNGVPCGNYGNHWRCTERRCEFLSCEGDAECVLYGESIGAPNARDYVCVDARCGDSAFCAPSRSCTDAGDCCDDARPVPCGTYSNRWACEGGRCHAEGCDDDRDCADWANALALPNADEYTCG